jgi:chromosome segregation ATPase
MTFKAMRALARGGGADEIARLDHVFESFKEGQRTFGSLMAQAERSTQYLSQELTELAAEREQHIAALDAGLSAAQQRATEREQHIAALDAGLSVAQQRATEREEHIAALEAGLSTAQQRATEREEHIAALEAGLSVARQLATQREHRIGSMLNSNSWRITAPLRWLRRQLSLRR